MAALLSKKYFKFTLAALILLGCSVFCNPSSLLSEARADYYLDNFSTREMSTSITPFASDYAGKSSFSAFSSGTVPLSKQKLTREEKEKIRIAKEALKEKKINFSTQEFIKQIKKNKTENVNLMLEAGISPNADYFGEYALFYASKYNKTEIAKTLLEKGANPNLGFDSPLFWAVKNNNFELSKMLVENGAKVDFVELVSSKSILYLALKKGNLEIARLLIENGAKVDAYSMAIINSKDLFEKLGVERP